MLRFKVINGQELIKVGFEKIAAGTNDIYAQFELSGEFTDGVKSYWATSFYENPIVVALDSSGICRIPEEVLTAKNDQRVGVYDHSIYISLADIGRTTSSVCEVPVEKTVYSSTPVNPGVVTKDLVDQLMAENASFKQNVAGMIEAIHSYKFVDGQTRTITVAQGLPHLTLDEAIPLTLKAGDKFYAALLSNDGNFPSSEGVNVYAYDTSGTRQRFTDNLYSNTFREYTATVDMVGVYAQRSNNRITVDADLTFVVMVSGDYISPLEKRLRTLEQHHTAVYVSGSTGDDTNPGTSALPFKTIQKGVDSGAETVYVEPGEYHEYVDIHNKSSFHLLPTPYPSFNEVKTTVLETPKIHIHGDDTLTRAMRIYDCGNVVIEDVWCDHVTRQICHCINVRNLVMNDCRFSNNNGAAATDESMGLTLVNVNGVFRDCEAYNIKMDGFNIHGFGNTEFINCSAHDCGDDGVSHHDGATGFVNGGEYYNCAKGGVCTPTYGAHVNVANVYSHNNRYGIYAAGDSGYRPNKGYFTNCVLKNNTETDFRLVAGSYVAANMTYDTKEVTASATLVEY